ncbi:outer-membrane lipoproteins carrier protein [Moraxella macacae 0408225]|uniref:Outer-membrane lipoprotein carrier protein n=1 Tax=Moraxella macacae 0408225 TaxID=1230338 RepID=L2F7A5_9GAMM|nr:outer membrane lipoprotein chaperone LolA [Moraxella macacae]ELA08785.1 outer-membrane lipoproteins carrier protein [Moraxella macacae 0408225]
MLKQVTTSVSIAVLLMSAPLITSIATAQAKPASEATASKNLNNLLINVKSMSADFSQSTKTAKSTNRSFSGTMVMQRPNNFRWHTTGNAEQLVIADGHTLWIYDKDLQQATRQSVNSQMGDTPALLLSGDPAKIAANFKVTQPDVNKNYYVLQPKSSNANFKSLSLSFSHGNPVMMVLNDNLGQTTNIKFSNVKRNMNVEASQFTFSPPKGVDVIDQ